MQATTVFIYSLHSVALPSKVLYLGCLEAQVSILCQVITLGAFFLCWVGGKGGAKRKENSVSNLVVQEEKKPSILIIF